MEKCKVITCKNHICDDVERASAYGIYDYCQIHTLERLRMIDKENPDYN